MAPIAPFLVVLPLIFSAFHSAFAQARVAADPASEARPFAGRKADVDALAAAGKVQEAAQARESLARELSAFFGPGSETAAALDRALESGDQGAADRALVLALGNLSFAPLVEAPLPEGWPAPTPVDRIEVRSYPAYRAARVEAPGVSDNRMFWTLFNHIKERSIPMTAPVEMAYAGGGGRPAAMAFLYRSPGEGRAGQAGTVEVRDEAPALAASLGIRGNLTPERIEAARARLEAWLSEHGKAYTAAGEMRVLGYNSPFVPWFRRYSEIQIPIRPAVVRGV